MQDNKSFKKLIRVMTDVTSLPSFITGYFNPTIDDLNDILRRITFKGNIDCDIIENIKIPATTTIRIPHRFSTPPRHRIITRQSGGGLITDGEFTKDHIELRNNGIVDGTISIIILKE